MTALGLWSSYLYELLILFGLSPFELEFLLTTESSDKYTEPTPQKKAFISPPLSLLTPTFLHKQILPHWAAPTIPLHLTLPTECYLLAPTEILRT